MTDDLREAFVNVRVTQMMERSELDTEVFCWVKALSGQRAQPSVG